MEFNYFVRLSLLIAASLLSVARAQDYDDDDDSSDAADGQYHGVELGEFEATTSGAKRGVKGVLFMADSKRLVIDNFFFDGKDSCEFYFGKPGWEWLNDKFVGQATRSSYGTIEKYTGEDVIIYLPKGKKITDFGCLAIYCPAAKTSAGVVTGLSDTDDPEVVKFYKAWEGPHTEVGSDSVTMLDANTIHIRKFKYTPSPGVETVFAVGEQDGEPAFNDPTMRLLLNFGKIGKYTGSDVYLYLPDYKDAQKWKYLAIVRQDNKKSREMKAYIRKEDVDAYPIATLYHIKTHGASVGLIVGLVLMFACLAAGGGGLFYANKKGMIHFEKKFPFIKKGGG